MWTEKLNLIPIHSIHSIHLHMGFNAIWRPWFPKHDILLLVMRPNSSEFNSCIDTLGFSSVSLMERATMESNQENWRKRNTSTRTRRSAAAGTYSILFRLSSICRNSNIQFRSDCLQMCSVRFSNTPEISSAAISQRQCPMEQTRKWNSGQK